MVAPAFGRDPPIARAQHDELPDPRRPVLRRRSSFGCDFDARPRAAREAAGEELPTKAPRGRRDTRVHGDKALGPDGQPRALPGPLDTPVRGRQWPDPLGADG